MRNKNQFYCLLILYADYAACIVLRAQIPPQQWAMQYGGSNVDIPFVIKFTADGGTIVAGYTDSKNGDVSSQPNRDYWDLWVSKTG